MDVLKATRGQYRLFGEVPTEKAAEDDRNPASGNAQFFIITCQLVENLRIAAAIKEKVRKTSTGYWK